MSDRLDDLLESAKGVRKSTRGNLASYKHGASVRKYGFEISDEEADALFRSPCHYCGFQPFQRFNGIDRVVNSLGYVNGNVVACCTWCNRAKGRFPVEDFLNWLRWVRSAVTSQEPPTPQIDAYRDVKWAAPAVPPERRQYFEGCESALDLRGLTPKEYVRRKIYGEVLPENSVTEPMPDSPIPLIKHAKRMRAPKPIRPLRAHNVKGFPRRRLPALTASMKSRVHFNPTPERLSEKV